MFNTLFGEGQYALKMLFAFIVVFGLLALALWLVRRFSGERLSNAGSRGRQPRLAVIDAAQVDSRRRLVLVRRDNVEHLLMIGGPSDLVVEPNIVRAGTPAREAASARAVPASEALPRALPAGEENMWPLQPEPMPRAQPGKSEPPPRPEPRLQRSAPVIAPATAPRTEQHKTEQHKTEQHITEQQEEWAAPEPETPAPPPVPIARERWPRNDALSGLAEELGRSPPAPEPPRFQPPVRQAPRREPRARPQPPAPMPSGAPSTAASLRAPADQNLAEMAQRLEAALRRPNVKEEARPPAAGPKPEGEPGTPEAATGNNSPTDDTASAPATGAETAQPARNTDTPARTEGKPAPQKSLYDSLEQEMASLLGRPNSN